MVSFLVVGEGFPAFNVLNFLLSKSNARVAGYVAGSHASVKAIELAKCRNVELLDPAILTGAAFFPSVADADWLININGVTLISKEVIARFPMRALNMHPALLPNYAGLHCHQWAIRNGERLHGATIHFMDSDIDAGPIIRQVRTAIQDEDTGLSLFMRTMNIGAECLLYVLDDILKGTALSCRSQDISQRRVYFHRHALDGTIDWSWPAEKLINFVRAANYEPLASPTYQPLWRSLNGDIIIKKLRRGEVISSEAPGKIVDVCETGPVISCGSGETVVITKAFHMGKPVPPSDWNRFLINAG